jgi:hypothetical protein
LPFSSVKDWPISLLPTGIPLRSTIEPPALSFRPGSWATSQMNSGYPRPTIRVNTSRVRKAAQC